MIITAIYPAARKKYGNARAAAAQIDNNCQYAIVTVTQGR